MALDPSLFMQGAQLRAQNDANTQNIIGGFFDKLAATKERQRQLEIAKANDYEGSAQRVLLAQAQGAKATPDDLARAQVWDKMNTMQNAIDPTTGNIYAKNRSLFDTLGTSPSTTEYVSPYSPPTGINPAMPPMPQGQRNVINDLGGDLVMPLIGDNYSQVRGGVTAPMGASPKTQQRAQEVNLDLQKESALEKLKQQTASEIEQNKINKLDLNTLPILESMLDYNKGTINAPYAGSAPATFATRLTNPDAATNMDLLKQNRLELAAPLAKQLGVNPTDKDFQATLNRIFDENASKESREAQINNLIRRVKIRQGIDTGAMQKTGGKSLTTPSGIGYKVVE